MPRVAAAAESVAVARAAAVLDLAAVVAAPASNAKDAARHSAAVSGRCEMRRIRNMGSPRLAHFYSTICHMPAWHGPSGASAKRRAVLSPQICFEVPDGQVR